MVENRSRPITIKLRVTAQEHDLIERKMVLLGISNREAYLRKMALDGYAINLDLSAVKELVSLLRRCSNNLNQYTKKAHETDSIYAADVDDLHRRFDRLWEAVRKILSSLGKL